MFPLKWHVQTTPVAVNMAYIYPDSDTHTDLFTYKCAQRCSNVAFKTTLRGIRYSVTLYARVEFAEVLLQHLLSFGIATCFMRRQ
jgi:hypothetical protein